VTTSLPAEVTPEDIVGMAAVRTVIAVSKVFAVYATPLRKASRNQLQLCNVVLDVERPRLGVVDAQVDLVPHMIVTWLHAHDASMAPGAPPLKTRC